MREWHSSDRKEVKPLSAISMFLSKVSRGWVEVGGPNDVHRKNSVIFAKVFISSDCIMNSGLATIGAAYIPVETEDFTSLSILDREVEKAWIDCVNLLVEGDPHMEMLRSITMAFLFSESSLDPFGRYR